MKFLLKNALLSIFGSLVFVLSVHASAFDGQWKGEAVTQSGKCKNKFTFNLDITGGFITGSVSGKKKSHQLEGSVNDDGSFNIDVVGMNKEAFSGVISGDSGTGSWRSGKCTGKVYLNK